MNTVVVMQPYFFPYLGYYQLAAASNVFVLLDDVTFIKGGWINRNRYLIQGRDQYFTVPLQSPSSYRSIAATLIANGPRWRLRMLRSLEQAYARAPYRQAVLGLVERVLTAPHNAIGNLAAASVRAVCSHVGLPVTWQTSSEMHPPDGATGAKRVLAICQTLQATRYVNAPGGKKLYDSGEFAQAGIELRFLRPVLPTYNQSGASFVRGLSIIDVLMFNPPELVRTWMEAYELE